MTDDADAVRAARGRLVAAGTARIDCTIEHTWNLPEFPARQRSGQVRRAFVGVGKATAKVVGRGISHVLSRADLRHQSAEGVIDFTGRRFMIDYGHFAELQIGDQEWHGRSGRPLSTLPASAASVGSPLWLVDLIGGTTSAAVVGPQGSQAEPWLQYTMTADLAEASSQIPDGLPSPARDRFEDVFRLPVDGWLDDTCLRKVRFTEDHRITTVTFSDFGTDVGGLDWDRLPTFRSPDEQQEVGKTKS